MAREANSAYRSHLARVFEKRARRTQRRIKAGIDTRSLSACRLCGGSRGPFKVFDDERLCQHYTEAELRSRCPDCNGIVTTVTLPHPFALPIRVVEHEVTDGDYSAPRYDVGAAFEARLEAAR